MEFKCKFEVSGKVLEVGKVQEFSSGFTKRDVIIEASKKADEFSNPVCVTFKKDACSQVDGIHVGDGVAVDGFVEGRRWERDDGKVRYFIDLSAKSVIFTEKAQGPTTAASWKELRALGEFYGEDKEAVEARCDEHKQKIGGKKFEPEDWQKLASDIVKAHAPDAGAQAPAEDDDDMPF